MTARPRYAMNVLAQFLNDIETYHLLSSICSDNITGPDTLLNKICTMSSLISRMPLTGHGMQPHGPQCGSRKSVQI